MMKIKYFVGGLVKAGILASLADVLVFTALASEMQRLSQKSNH